MLGTDDAIWVDGEWMGRLEIDKQIEKHEWRVKHLNSNLALIPVFKDLLCTAQHYHSKTGQHLNVYGDIGELYAAITLGLKLLRNHAQASDGRLGNDFVEVKTITPFKKHNKVMVKRAGNFNKILIVKINENFEIASQLICRKNLPKGDGKNMSISWADYSKN